MLNLRLQSILQRHFVNTQSKSTCPRTYSFIDGNVFAYGGTQTENVMEYTRCNSHILDVAAKALADAAAKAARSAAQGILGGN